MTLGGCESDGDPREHDNVLQAWKAVKALLTQPSMVLFCKPGDKLQVADTEQCQLTKKLDPEQNPTVCRAGSRGEWWG